MKQLHQQDPRTIGEFRLLGRLGNGGFGTVYLGRSSSRASVAIKVAHSHYSRDPEFRERFRREVTAVRMVSGWFTAALVAADTEAPQPWLATEFIPAPTLQSVVDACGPLPLPAVWWIARGIAEALVSIHRAGLLHRDLKPRNVLVTPDGVRLIDFGIAKLGDTSGFTRPGVAMGTPGYMPPEQVDLRTVGRAGDVYGLAATLLFAATGHAPYTGLSVTQVFTRLRTKEPPDLDGIPSPLRPLVSRCLSCTPEERMDASQVLLSARRQLHSAERADGTPVLPRRALEHIAAHIREVNRRTPPSPGPGGTVPLPETQAACPARKPWRRPLEGWMPSAPVVLGGALYISASGGAVYAMDAVSGRLRWRTLLDGGQVSPPGAYQDLVLVGGRGRVVAFDAATGKIRWTTAIDDQFDAQPVALDGAVYISGRSGDVHRLDAASGTPRWRYPTGGGAASAPCIARGTLWVGGADGRLHAIRAANGEPVWRYATGGAVEAPPTWHQGSLYAGSSDRCVYALDAATGTRRWQHHTGGPVRSAPAVLGGTVYSGSTDGGLYALDAADGGIRWRYRTGGAIRCAPVVSGDTVYSGSLDEHIYALDAETGAVRWRYRTGAWIASTAAVAEGLVYLGSYDKHIYALDAVSGAGPEDRPDRP